MTGKIVILLLAFTGLRTPSCAQEQEIEQLVLNIEKLAQFKQLLQDMKTGYEILSQGYEAVKNISQGNFELHRRFLDGLLEVSPAVKQYRRIADIIAMQKAIISTSRYVIRHIDAADLLNEDERNYLRRVDENVTAESIDEITTLTSVLTAGLFRMSDAERLRQIDELFISMENKLAFLRQFNTRTTVLVMQRKKELEDVKGMRTMTSKTNE